MNQAAQEQTPIFCLQDSRSNIGENLSFWGKTGGYTTNLSDAALFSAKDAFSQNASRPSDVPWPITYLEQHSRKVVDMQHLNAQEASRISKGISSQEYFLQTLPAEYSGNDIYMLAKDLKSKTTNLQHAAQLTQAQLDDIGAAAGVKWPVVYLASVCRLAVDCHKVDIKEALKDTCLALAKRDKPYREIFRCHGCGVFMSAVDYYTSSCGKCGAENRP